MNILKTQYMGGEANECPKCQSKNPVSNFKEFKIIPIFFIIMKPKGINMIKLIRSIITEESRAQNAFRFIVFVSMLIFNASISFSKDIKLSGYSSPDKMTSTKVIYRNPQVMNVEYSFELAPDPEKIERSKDLKLWIPIPREWESQKGVKIVSVEPPAHAEYQDPEHGNHMLFWDFGKEPEKPSYKVYIKFRLESYETRGVVDPERIGSYDKSSEEYVFYTRSSHTIHILPKIKELAKEAVGNEKNPYRQAMLIHQFVRKRMRHSIIGFDKGKRGIGPMLDDPIINEKTGDELYKGTCSENSAFFIALCRAIGIPARAVVGFVGWKPGVMEGNLKRHLPSEFEVSPLGLAGTQDYFPCSPHQWAEFYIPNYGWIPRDDPQENFGHLENGRAIMSKGRDIQLGPDAPQEQDNGYGFQWVLVQDGRVDALMTGVWNIAKIRTAIAKILHHSDPFPADAMAIYNGQLFPEEDAEERCREWRKWILSCPSRYGRSCIPGQLNVEQLYAAEPQFMGNSEAFVCHMLRRYLGDKKFFDLVDRYLGLRLESNRPVSTSSFQQLAKDVAKVPLDWFFNQWINKTALARLKLTEATARKDQKGWKVHARLLQEEETALRLLVELELVTKSGRERHQVWIDSRALDFELRTQSEPQKLVVDPDFEILKIQRMPPRLCWYWDNPDFILIYGTLAEEEANKAAADRLNLLYLGGGKEIIKADIDVNETDLKKKSVMLFGRPETNMISQRLKDVFPIKFDENKFIWQGRVYDQPTQGAAQIVENPNSSKSFLILYAGLSSDAILSLFDFGSGKLKTDKSGWFPHESDASYYIYDGYEKLLSGDWEEFDSNLVWNFK
jgi:hypothetical protein